MATRIKSSQIADGAIVAADLHSAITVSTTSSGTFGSVIVDNYTLGSNRISTNQANSYNGDLMLDSAGEIILDADGGDILIKDNGSHKASITMNSNVQLSAKVADEDILFRGVKAGTPNTVLTALTLDMSNDGRATFNENIVAGGTITGVTTLTSSGVISTSNTTGSTNTTSGALTVAGGVGIAENAYIGGNVIVTGNLTVEGTQVTLNTSALDVEDKNITLNYHASNDTSASADGAGITIQDAVDASNDASILWDATNDKFTMSHGLTLLSATHLQFTRGGELRSTDTGGAIRTLARVNGSNELEYGWSANGAVKFMGGGSYTERMRIHTNSNIGINDIAPHGTLTVTGPRILVQRTNDDSSIAFANNTTGAPTSHAWAAGLNYSNSNAFTIAYGSSGVPSLESHKMVIDTSGNVGIGTDTPVDLLTIQSPASGGGNGITLKRNDNGTDQRVGAISFGNTEDDDLAVIAVKTSTGNNSDGNLEFYTQLDADTTPTKRMTIASDGNVGIGNVVSQAYANEGTYTAKLRVGSDTSGTDNASAIQIVGKDSSGNGILGVIEFLNHRDNDVVAKIAGRRDLGSGSHLGAGQLDFSTDDGNGNLDIHMSIDANGKVGIGIDSPAQPLHVDGATKSKNLYLTNASNASQSDAFIYWSDGSGTSELTFDANSTADSNIKFNTSEPAGSSRAAMWLQGDDWEDGGQSTTVYGRLKVVDGYGAKAGIETTQVRHNERPLLLLDFANSKRLDPRILFIRGTAGTYWDGKTTVKAEENLVTGSNDLTTGWSYNNTQKSTGHTAPDGTTTAVGLDEDTTTNTFHFGVESISAEPSSDYVFSIYAKSNERSAVFIVIRVDGGAKRYAVNFNLSNGTFIDDFNYNNATGTGYSITSVGDGWYRCSVTATNTSGNVIVCVGPNDGNTLGDINGSYSGTVGHGIYAWGAQVEQRSSATTYTSTTSAPVLKYQPALQTTGTTGVARFDHNPVTKECEGLLIENASTNLFPNSTIPFAGTTGNCKLLQNVATAPDGTQTADAVISNGAASSGYCYRGFSNVVGNGTFTLSGYIKRVRGTGSILFGIGSGASGNLHLLMSGSGDSMTVQTSVSTGMTGSHTHIQSVGNGWYRVCGTGTTTNAAGYTEFQGMPIGANTEWLIWGVQVEATTFPTSYIATSGSTVTRARDIAEIRDMRSKNILNPEEGTFYVEHKTAKTNNTLLENFAAGIGNDSSNYLGVLYSNAGDTYLQPTHGSVGTSASMTIPVPPDGKWKSATLWKTESDGDTTARVSVNGVNSTDDTVAGTTIFKNNNDPDLTIGSADFSAGSKFGWIRKIAVYGTDIGTATANALTEV